MNTTTKKRSALQRLSAIVLGALIAVTMSGASAFAATAPTVEDTEYKGKGRVEVEFKGNVAWKDAKVVVKDLDGKTYKTTIIEKDSDEIDFRIKEFQKNRTYKITIKGVKVKGTTGYTSVKTKVYIPKAGKIVIEDIEYDKYDKEVSFDFQTNVQWNNAKVTITDSNGKNYVTKIIEKDRDSIEVKVKGMTYGKKYNYKISGIRKAGTKDYVTKKGTFKAVGD